VRQKGRETIEGREKGTEPGRAREAEKKLHETPKKNPGGRQFLSAFGQALLEERNDSKKKTHFARRKREGRKMTGEMKKGGHASKKKFVKPGGRSVAGAFLGQIRKGS